MVLPSLTITESEGLTGQWIMTFYSTTNEVRHVVSDAIAKVRHDDTRVFADQAAVFLFVAAGLWLMATFVLACLGAEIGQILAVSG